MGGVYYYHSVCLVSFSWISFFGWDKGNVDVWEDTTGSDSSVSHKFGELLVVSDSKLDVSWDDSASFVISGGVTCELEDLGGEVFKDGGEIDWGTGSNSLGVSSNSEVSGDSSNWELKSGSGGSADWSGCG